MFPRAPRPGLPRRHHHPPRCPRGIGSRPGMTAAGAHRELGPVMSPPLSTGTAAAVGETWRRVPACRWFGIPANTVEASSEGRVRTLPRTLSDGREIGVVGLLPQEDKDGYLYVKVAGKRVGVHVLVCLAFHGPPEVRHLSGDRQVNKPAELAWGSHRDNEQDKKKQRKGRTPS